MRTLLALALVLPALAQAALMPPLPGVSPSQPSYVVLEDGTRLDGEVRAVSHGQGAIRELTLVDAEGQKHHLDAEQVVELGHHAGGFLRAAARADASDSVAAHNVYDGRERPDWVVWQQLTHPVTGKSWLVQRLNPSSDGRVQVYVNPNAQETGGFGVGVLQLTGGVERSYLIVKDGGEPEVLRKRGYKAQFEALFGDCAEMETSGRIDWKDLGEHVDAYEAACPAR